MMPISLHFSKKNSPKIRPIQNKVAISSPRSKSVNTYLKEWECQEITSKFINEDKVNKNNKNDSTEISNILSALKRSSKGSLHYPEEFENFENSKEICDFKYIGDICHLELSYNEENSFREIPEEVDESKDYKTIEKPVSPNRNFRIDEELDFENDLSLSSRLNKGLLISQLQIDSEIKVQSLIQLSKRKETYLRELEKIRQDAEANLDQHRKLNQEESEKNQNMVQFWQDASEKEVVAIMESYEESLRQRQADVLKKVKEIRNESIRNEAYIESLLQIFKDHLQKLQQKLDKVQKQAENCTDPELCEILFENLPSVLSTMQMSMESDFLKNPTEEQINFKLDKVKESQTVLEKISKLIDSREEQQAKADADAKALYDRAVADAQAIAVRAAADAQAIADRTAADAKAIADSAPPNYPSSGDALVALVAPNSVDAASKSDASLRQLLLPVSQQQFSSAAQSSSNQSTTDNQHILSSLPDDEKTFSELKNKYCAVSLEADKLRENVNLRPLLTKAVGIINQLNNTKFDSSNRSKLHQIINLISGKNCTFGDNTVSTQNNLVARAFVMEQLAARLVSLSHDIQVSTMAVYASLIVRLWQLYPDLGELILFKLYETCPFLVPLTIRKKDTQTEEEFNRSMGFRHKDGAYREAIDKYLTRMGSAAQLYARIVAMEVDNHPHGIEEGWKFLARTLSIQPYPSITAAVLHGFLSVAGYSLNKTYKKQFKKLIQYLYMTYLPLIEKDTLEGVQSDVVSLKLLVEQYARTNNFPQSEEGYRLLI